MATMVTRSVIVARRRLRRLLVSILDGRPTTHLPSRRLAIVVLVPRCAAFVPWTAASIEGGQVVALPSVRFLWFKLVH